MHRKRRPIAALSALFLSLGFVITLSACSPVDDTDRAAAGDWPARMTCPEKSSWTAPVVFDNTTAVPIKLQAGEIDCYDWSGVSTPPTVFNDKVVGAKSQNTFHLEARDNIDRYWSMRFSVTGEKPSALRDVRVKLASGTGGVYVYGPQSESVGNCLRVALGPDPAATASPPLPADTDAHHIMLWSDGGTIYAVKCASGGGPALI